MLHEITEATVNAVRENVATLPKDKILDNVLDASLRQRLYVALLQDQIQMLLEEMRETSRPIPRTFFLDMAVVCLWAYQSHG